MTSTTRTRKLTERKYNQMSGYLFTSPFFILYAIFGLFPMFFSFYLSFFKWDGLTPMTYVGLDNFKFILNDSIFYSSIVNTFIIGILVTLPQDRKSTRLNSS